MTKTLFKKNSKVSWKWLGKTIDGVICEIYFEPIVKEIKGKKIKRNGTLSNPAYFVQSEAGNFALKLQTELTQRDNKAEKQISRPKIFS